MSTSAKKGRAGSMLVALLRGINVGSARRVAMADLRTLVEGLGFHDVRTLLNSGNVVFSAPGRSDPARAALSIQDALEEKLGVAARVIVIDAEELSEIASANPLTAIADNPSRLLVGILADAADKEKLSEIAARDWGNERIAFGATRAVYMWMPAGVIESRLNAAVSKVLKDGVTARNWATMLKLQDMTRETGHPKKG